MRLPLGEELAVRLEPLAKLNGEERSLDDPRARVAMRGGGLAASWPDGVEVSLRARRMGAAWRVIPTLRSERHTIRIDALGVRLRAAGASRILVDGYHSWDWAGVRDATVAGHGWWGALWGTPHRPWHAVAVGLAEPPRVGALALAWDGTDRLDALLVGPPLQEPLRSGDPRSLGIVAPPGSVLAGDPLRLAAIDGTSPGGSGLPRLRRSDRKPGPRRVGWMSWNCLGGDVCAADVVEAATTYVPPGGVTLLDDGWERAWGDWTERADFDSAIADLADALGAAGRILGLWLAPFHVDPDTEAAATFSPLLLRDDAGDPVVDPRSPRRSFVLDVGRPEVLAHLEELGRRLGGFGVGVLKIDFLYAAALPAKRDLGVSPVAALRSAVAALATGFWSAAGRSAPIWACGAPAPPLVGLVDACRSGGDAVVNVPSASAPPPPQPWFAHGTLIRRAQERNLAARSWLWGGTVPPDVDAVTLGAVGYVAPLEDQEAKEWLDLAVRAGGPLLVADEPTGTLVPPERLDDLRRAQQQVAGRPAVPARPAEPLRLRPTPADEDTFYTWPADLPERWLPPG